MFVIVGVESVVDLRKGGDFGFWEDMVGDVDYLKIFGIGEGRNVFWFSMNIVDNRSFELWDDKVSFCVNIYKLVSLFL